MTPKLNNNIVSIMKQLDKDNDGQINAEDFIDVVKMAIREKESKRAMPNMFYILGAAFFLLMTATVLLTLAIVLLSQKLDINECTGALVLAKLTIKVIGGGGVLSI